MIFTVTFYRLEYTLLMYFFQMFDRKVNIGLFNTFLPLFRLGALGFLAYCVALRDLSEFSIKFGSGTSFLPKNHADVISVTPSEIFQAFIYFWKRVLKFFWKTTQTSSIWSDIFLSIFLPMSMKDTSCKSTVLCSILHNYFFLVNQL